MHDRYVSPAIGKQADELFHFVANAIRGQAKVHEHLAGHAFLLSHQAEEQMFGTDEIVIESASFLDGKLDGFLRPWSQRRLPCLHVVAPRSCLDNPVDL